MGHQLIGRNAAGPRERPASRAGPPPRHASRSPRSRPVRDLATGSCPAICLVRDLPGPRSAWSAICLVRDLAPRSAWSAICLVRDLARAALTPFRGRQRVHALRPPGSGRHRWPAPRPKLRPTGPAAFPAPHRLRSPDSAPVQPQPRPQPPGPCPRSARFTPSCPLRPASRDGYPRPGADFLRFC